MAVLLVGFHATVGKAQTPAQVQQLSIADALRLAEERNEQIAIARAGVMRAGGEQLRARSELFPQIFASLGYTRTLASEFSAFSDGGEDDGTDDPTTESCGSFTPNPALPILQRLDSLEKALECASNEDPFSAFRNLPFGRENQYSFGVTASQTVFSGGRVQAQSRIASAGRRSSEIALQTARAQLALEVAQAYWDAMLSDRLLAIAEATLQQAESTLGQIRLARQVGDQPEFEQLRAQVTRDTQQPVVIQRRADRDVAHHRLRQLLDLPLDAVLTLTTSLDDIESIPAGRLVSNIVEATPDTSAALRAPVRQAAEAVNIVEAQRAIARSQRLPALSLSSSWSRVAYPTSGLPSAWNQFRSNWTISANVSVPIFTGFRIAGEEQVAQASLDEARAALSMTRELAALDTRSSLEQLRAAEATWRASMGTVEQANKAFQIAEIRFREGLSTQLELADSRILLQQAQANRAMSARNLQVARLRVALLPLLPIGQSGAPAAPLVTPQAPESQRQQQQTPSPGVGRPGVIATQNGGR
jgi:outer membrane protein TolC